MSAQADKWRFATQRRVHSLTFSRSLTALTTLALS
jgi:hypothetical protein